MQTPQIPQPIPQAFPPPQPPREKPHEDRIMRGIVFALLAYFMFGIMQAGAKLLTENHSVVEVAFYRNLIAFIPLAAWFTFKKQWHILKTKRPKIVAFRGIFGTLSLMITFLTFHYLPLATATVLLFTATIITPALAFFILKEHIGWRRWSAIIIGLVGVILMVGPTGQAPLFGILLAMVTACSWATINITLRYLKTENPLAVTFSFIFCGIVIPGVAMPFIASTPAPDEWLLFLMVGFSGGLGQFFLTSAFSNAPASLVAMFNYTGLLWATLFDIVLWQFMPGLSVFVGGAIILLANLYIVHRERVNELKKKNQATGA
jgi:drug/metabolite transporter (DMT)-like permease